MKKWEIGIDEAGRGPLAGPVAVGIVMVPVDFDWSLLPGVGDSKKVSEKNRERIYVETLKLAKGGQLWCTVEMAGAQAIDKRGIAIVIRECIDKGLKTLILNTKYKQTSGSRKDIKLEVGSEKDINHIPINWSMIAVKLDGSLRAPDYCVNQETIIKGDAKEKVIGLASILAKVTRDRYMCRLAIRPAFVKYEFGRHKGYGTERHRRSILENGLSSEHRHTYCKNFKSMV